MFMKFKFLVSIVIKYFYFQEETSVKTLKMPTVQNKMNSTLSATVLNEAVGRQKQPAAKTEVLPTISSEDEAAIPMHDANQIYL